MVFGAILCALQAVRAKRLLAAALYLAGVSVFSSIAVFLLGAAQVAVVELSVGAGLVTVLMVFAIAIAGDDGILAPAVIPRTLAGLLALGAALLAAWLSIPLLELNLAATEVPFADLFWEVRGLDAIVQVGLIFAGVMGILGLLVERKGQLR